MKLCDVIVATHVRNCEKLCVCLLKMSYHGKSGKHSCSSSDSETVTE